MVWTLSAMEFIRRLWGEACHVLMCFQQDDSACRLRLEEKQGQRIRYQEASEITQIGYYGGLMGLCQDIMVVWWGCVCRDGGRWLIRNIVCRWHYQDSRPRHLLASWTPESSLAPQTHHLPPRNCHPSCSLVFVNITPSRQWSTTLKLPHAIIHPVPFICPLLPHSHSSPSFRAASLCLDSQVSFLRPGLSSLHMTPDGSLWETDICLKLF